MRAAFNRAVEEVRSASDGLVVAVLVCSPILWTPYQGDDLINKGLPAAIARGETTVLAHFAKYTLQWMNEQGRFFPGSVAWGTAVFTTFTDRLAYKSLLFLLALASLISVWLFLWWAFEHKPAVPTLLVGAGFWALRPVGFDGLSGFAGLLPWTVVLSLLGTVLLGSSRRVLVGIGGIAWAVALMTYEVAILLVPAMCVLLWLKRRRTGALTLGSVAFVDLAFVAWLRLGVDPIPAYTLSLEPTQFLGTAAKQAVAGLPLSTWWWPGIDHSPFPVQAWVLWAVCFALVVVIARFADREAIQGPVSAGTVLPAALVGLSAWLLPSALVGATQRWQAELSWGVGYLSVVWSYVGLAVLTACVVEVVWRAFPNRSAAAAVRVLCVLFLSGLAAATFISNMVVAARAVGM